MAESCTFCPGCCRDIVLEPLGAEGSHGDDCVMPLGSTRSAPRRHQLRSGLASNKICERVQSSALPVCGLFLCSLCASHVPMTYPDRSRMVGLARKRRYRKPLRSFGPTSSWRFCQAAPYQAHLQRSCAWEDILCVGVLTSPTVRDQSGHGMGPTEGRREQRKGPEHLTDPA